MRWLIWVVGIVAFLVMLYSCALPGDLAVGRDDPSGLSGVYTVNGLDPVGTEYSGTITIRDTDTADVYDVEWIVTGAIQHGRGVVTGDRMAVTWDEVNNATGRGTSDTEYVIAPDGSMTGTWVAAGFDQPGTEEVFPEP
ncbi:MAG: hypothetical protein ACK5RL_19540 [Acidimicrobiales bacterium]